MPPWLSRFSGKESVEGEMEVSHPQTARQGTLPPEKQPAEDDWERLWIDLGGEA